MSDWARCINSPHKLIEQLVHQAPVEILRGKPKDDWGVTKYFQTNLCGHSNKIPSLNDTPLELIRPNTLVRYRCMVQDTYDPELYLGVYEEVNKATGDRDLKTGKYKDAIETDPATNIEYNPPQAITLERLPLYCIPIPGESRWVKQKHAQETQPFGIDAARSSKASNLKRGRSSSNPEQKESEDVEMSDVTPSSAGAATPSDTDKRTKTSSEGNVEMETENSKPSSEVEKDFGKSACIVKLYNEFDDQLRVCDAVEFIGILTKDVDISAGDVGDDNDGVTSFQDAARNPLSSLVPRIHCISYQKLNLEQIAGTQGSAVGTESEAKVDSLPNRLTKARSLLGATRSSLTNYITECLGGDKLAAEYLLIHLITKIHSTPSGATIGKFCLSLSGCPKHERSASSDLNVSTFGNLVASLYELLLPSVVNIPLSLKKLNSSSFQPVKNHDKNILEFGELQMCKGTPIVLDQTVMEPGKLESAGVLNVCAIKIMIERQQLNYDFKYHQISFETRNQVLVLSDGKSILPNDCRMHLKQEHPTPSQLKDVDPGMLSAWREYIQLARNTMVELTSGVKQIAEQDFVASRQADKTITEQWFHVRLSLARTLAATFLENELVESRWAYMKNLEMHRLERLK